MIGPPSLHALDSASGPRIWLAAEAADMRCGFDRLAERVRSAIGEEPLSGHPFLFRSRNGDRLKILTWDRDGYVLWYKRLETGVFKLPPYCAWRWFCRATPERVSDVAGWHRHGEAEACAAL